MVFNGKLSDLPGHLDGLRDEDAFDQALRSLRHTLFVQGTVVPAAESVAPQLVAAAVELPGERRDRVIELAATLLDAQGPTPDVLRAFAAHERIWGYLNFIELLQRHGQPAHRTPPPLPR
ncbi:hypothetical protein Dvina_19755 [Dactylosporangium vinaceum]|uniref:Uncharacterized protein n=1 Tax=Dactylosporangium vinaceum TaxID=53362 RepID=A0ABV5M9S9_9ACTN|nr:hypothetical protein [Dactylosporangium vinaceum]UAC00095.1 hypothetical protein Dvina_19755 [Dactylosporangium vinaceum]